MSDNPENKHVMQMWSLAIGSGYATTEAWSAYADEIMLAMDSPPFWIIELACSSDAETASTKLGQIDIDEGLPSDFCDQRRIHMGYRYKLLTEGRISVEEFCEEQWTHLEIDYAFDEHFPEAHQAILDADPSDDDSYLKPFYDRGHTDQELIEKFQQSFGEASDLAMSQFNYLLNQSKQDVISGQCIPNR